MAPCGPRQQEGSDVGTGDQKDQKEHPDDERDRPDGSLAHAGFLEPGAIGDKDRRLSVRIQTVLPTGE